MHWMVQFKLVSAFWGIFKATQKIKWGRNEIFMDICLNCVTCIDCIRLININMLKTITLRNLNHLLQNNGQVQLWASTLKKINAILHSTYLGVMKKLFNFHDKQCLSRNYRDYLEFTFEYDNIIMILKSSYAWFYWIWIKYESIFHSSTTEVTFMNDK